MIDDGVRLIPEYAPAYKFEARVEVESKRRNKRRQMAQEYLYEMSFPGTGGPDGDREDNVFLSRQELRRELPDVEERLDEIDAKDTQAQEDFGMRRLQEAKQKKRKSRDLRKLAHQQLDDSGSFDSQQPESTKTRPRRGKAAVEEEESEEPKATNNNARFFESDDDEDATHGDPSRHVSFHEPAKKATNNDADFFASDDDEDVYEHNTKSTKHMAPGGKAAHDGADAEESSEDIIGETDAFIRNADRGYQGRGKDKPRGAKKSKKESKRERRLSKEGRHAHSRRGGISSSENETYQLAWHFGWEKAEVGKLGFTKDAKGHDTINITLTWPDGTKTKLNDKQAHRMGDLRVKLLEKYKEHLFAFKVSLSALS